ATLACARPASAQAGVRASPDPALGGTVTDDFDRVLLASDDIEPSSGFTASVMSAVREEAATPPPIPFPWCRAVPAAVPGGLVFVVFTGAVARLPQAQPAPSPSVPYLEILQSLLLGAARPSILWSVAGICIALCSASIGSHLGHRRLPR